MSSPRLRIRKAAVLGAGVMGAQIAAHLANADVDVVLFDLPAKDGPPNGVVARALQNLGKLLIGENVVECLQGDLKYEKDIQRPLLVEAIALCEAQQDYVSRDLLEDLLEHCEEAIDWLETQQSLIENVTLPNYLQAHMEPGEG